MQGIQKITAKSALIAIANFDTDQVMPKQFLRGIDKQGLDKGVFYDLRYDGEGNEKPDFYGHQEEYKGAEILVAGPNFGCGSSREHAVWGMQQYGLKAVISTSFGEIFYSNAINNLLLPVIVTESDLVWLTEIVSKASVTMTIDIERRVIEVEGKTIAFQLQERHQKMFLEGTDLIGSTLKDQDLIKAFIAQRRQEAPWATDLAAKRKRLM